MTNTFKNEIYRSSRTLTYIVVGLLGAIGLCSVLYAVFSIGMIAFPDSQVNLGDGEVLNLALVILGLVALIESPLRFVCAILFLIWLYRSFNNLSALKARNLEFSPGWAVGWWFIPFANLVKPFQVVRELYNESSPDFDDETGFLNVSAGTPEIVGLWWATFLISGFAHRLADVLYGRGDSPASPYFPVVFMVAGIIASVAAASAITIVWRIMKMQEARSDKITTMNPASHLPPPPPSFGEHL